MTKRFRTIITHHAALPIFGRKVGEQLEEFRQRDHRFKWVARFDAFMSRGTSITGLIEYRTRVEELEA